MATFQEALNAFVVRLKEELDKNNATMKDWNKLNPPYSTGPELELGHKNIRVVVLRAGMPSVYCFIQKETGIILKAAGWKMPAKGSRGNIFNPETYAHMDWNTGWMYLRG